MYKFVCKGQSLAQFLQNLARAAIRSHVTYFTIIGAEMWAGIVVLRSLEVVSCHHLQSQSPPTEGSMSAAAPLVLTEPSTLWVELILSNLHNPAVGPQQFRRDLKTHWFTKFHASAFITDVFISNALYKSTLTPKLSKFGTE